MPSHPRDTRQDTALPDLTGWDSAPRGKDIPWHPEMRAQTPPNNSDRHWRYETFWIIFMAGATVALLCWMATPTFLGNKIPTNETAAVQNLKALATAQAQFIKKKDFYATSGSDLNTNGTLIALDLKMAFEQYHNNADAPSPSPKAGYIFRMLHGDRDYGATCYYKDPADPSKGMNTWGAIARASEPGTSGDNQYFITEAGTVYKHTEPAPGDPQFKQFLLDAVPNDWEIKHLGWTPAK